MRMRTNRFAQSSAPDPGQPSAPQPAPQLAAPSQPRTGKTFPADEIVWGIAIRHGFDEMDDPWYHRGTTQHAYLEGNDNVAICGFRPPQSGPRTRRRARLGLPTTEDHPMCGMCARMVVAPRPRVAVPVQPVRPAVPVPVSGDVPRPAVTPTPAHVNVAPRAAIAQAAAGQAPVGGPATSPWVRRATGGEQNGQATAPGKHDEGMLSRGIHTEPAH